MKNIKDYLHLYLGCDIHGLWGRGVLQGVDSNGWCMVLWNKNFTPDDDGHTYRKETEINHVKPILRPLSDMTEEERICLRSIHSVNYTYTDGYFDTLMRDAAATKWLLSKHFDLFGLIEAGLAIDKTQLNNGKE